MIASRIGLALVWACALVLAVILVVDLRGDSAPLDRALWPDFDPARVTALSWTDGTPVRLERDKDWPSGWKWTAPFGDADRQTVEDLFAALRGARWHRRAEVSAAGAITRTLVVEAGERLTFGVGQPLGEQQWLVSDNHALLVDRWVVHALAPEPVALRAHRPFAKASNAKQIEIGSFELVGTPRRLVKLAGLPIELLVKPSLIDDVERALGDVAVLAIPRSKIPVDTSFRGTRIALDGKLISVEAGKCPEPDRALHAIVGPAIGPNCIGEDAWAAVVAAASVFDGNDQAGRLKSLAAMVEPRPVSVEPIGVVLADGSLLDLAKHPRVRDPKQTSARDADPARVAELLAVLATPGEPVALPAAAPTGHLTIRAVHDVSVAIDLFPGSVIARHGEPIAIRIGEGSHAILARAGNGYVDPTLWTQEPLTIHVIQIGGTHYTRGAVVGEWTRDAQPADGKTLDQLAELLSSPRSLGTAPAVTAPRSVTLDIVPPAGPASKIVFTIGRSGTTCVGAVDTKNHVVDPKICELVDALAR